MSDSCGGLFEEFLAGFLSKQNQLLIHQPLSILAVPKPHQTSAIVQTDILGGATIYRNPSRIFCVR